MKAYMKIAFLLVVLVGCGRTRPIGEAPELSPMSAGGEYRAMMRPEVPMRLDTSQTGPGVDASLWSRGRGSLLGDRRAMHAGDILTVVIEIDEKAEISNTSARARSGSESMTIGALFGLPQRAASVLPEGANLNPGVELNSASKSDGRGTISRNEKLTLRIAATITGVQPNGVLAIEGLQEIRVNHEIRQLMVSGYVRPEDISRQNEITYDKIASARISYGGRGQITDMQQPRYGQQLIDTILPF